MYKHHVVVSSPASSEVRRTLEAATSEGVGSPNMVLAGMSRSTQGMRGRFSFSLLAAVLATAFLVIVFLLVLAPPASAALNSVPDGNTAQLDGWVRAMVVVGDRIYLGGDFTQVNGIPRAHLAALDANTGQLTSWNPNANASVRALAASPDGNRIYAGGEFTSVGGVAHGRLAAIDANGVVDGSCCPKPNYPVRALAVSSDGNRVYLGGSFTTVNGQSRSRLAAIDATTSALDPNWKPTASDTVRGLIPSQDGTRIYVGGMFGSISGLSRPYLAALDPITGAVQAWRPTTKPNGVVYTLAESGKRVYTAEGGGGGAAAAYDTVTGSRAWRQGADGDVQAVTVLGEKVYFGGHFGVFAGQSRRAFAAVDSATGALDAQWTPRASPTWPGVWALKTDPSRPRIYAGGEFTSVSGQQHQRFAQFSE